MTTYTLDFGTGTRPSAKGHLELTAAHQRYWEAREGGSNDDELDAASDFIEALMEYAGISGGDTEDGCQECDNCGEEVSYLSTRDWCDGCEEEAAS